MKRSTFTSSAVFFIPLLVAAVVYDSFTTGIRIFPSPVLSFLQGILLIAVPASACWFVARKIQFNREQGCIRIEINYGKSKGKLVNEKIY
jgi:hypothetical protein